MAHAIEACEHVQRSGGPGGSTPGDEMRRIFELSSDPDTMGKAIDELDMMLDRDSNLVRAYLPHLKQMRVHWHRFSRERST